MSGTLIYVIALWNAGITQGLMWRAYDENGALSYSFMESVQAMAPYYLMRTIGGAMFLVGAVICALNCRATYRLVPSLPEVSDRPLNPQPAE